MSVSIKSKEERFAHFVRLAEAKHGKGRYDYSLAQKHYRRTGEKVPILCRQCGEIFWKRPFEHTSAQPHRHGGCRKCCRRTDKPVLARWEKNLGERIKKFKEDFSRRHGKRYVLLYPEKEYRNISSRVTIQCSECGYIFQKQAHCAIMENRYAGCPRCNQQRMRQKIAEKNRQRQRRNRDLLDVSVPVGSIYRISNSVNGKFYIGYTTMDVKKRFKAHWDEAMRYKRGEKRCRSYLHHAMARYGKDAFRVETMYIYTSITPRELAMKERELIARLKPPYNVSPGGEIGRFNPHKEPTMSCVDFSKEKMTFRKLSGQEILSEIELKNKRKGH